jgi:long-chain acyl-CoA synthetase
VAWSLTDLGFNLLQAYGMTETAALTTVTPVTLEGIGSVGRPLPHTKVKIDHPDEHGVGQVMIRGESVTPEYFRNPEATREAFDEEGWLRSGDLGYFDKDGFLYITGRAKEVIVLSSGKNIYPEEIEHFYQSNCPLIKEICIIGVQDDTGHEGERLHAVIVPDFDELKRQQVVNAYHMIRYLTETLSQQLPPYKRMRSFEIWQEPLPRTTTRKVKRFDVEKRLRSGVGADTEAVVTWSPEDDVETRVTALLQEVKSAAPLHPDMNLELDIGLDSLERVEFLSSVHEAFQISIPDEEAAQLFTLRDVFDLVRERLDEPGDVEGEKKSWSDFLNEPLGEDTPKEYLRLLKRRPFVEPLVILVAITIRLISKLCFKLKGEGLENLPEDYPFMLCPNHLSFLDAFIVICLLPNRVVRRFYSLGYSDYFTGGLTGFLGSLVRTLPVNPDRNLKQTLRLAAEGLKNDLVLMVFPEGERSIDGTLKPFRKGPAILATQIGVPVVPVGIRGSYEVWRRGSGKIRFLPIRIHYGKPLKPQPGESVDDFNSRLREAVEELI